MAGPKKPISTILYMLAEAIDANCRDIGIDPRNPQQVKEYIQGMSLPDRLTEVVTEKLDQE